MIASPLTPLVGRQREIETICNLLSKPEVQLLTLTGPGGVGKTRLAVAAASELEWDRETGVVFIDLSPIRDPNLVLPTIASAVNVEESADKPMIELLAYFLSDRPHLLVLDNCEHVTPGVTGVSKLLDECPNLKVLATSRAELGLTSEQLLQISPLALPNKTNNRGPDELAKVESIDLFVRRAQAASPTFKLTQENANAVAEICLRLEGLPLALELAAARIKMLSPQNMIARLARRLPLLSAGRRDGPDRQRTLRETLAWSYDLLTPEEQAVFRQTAVFAGGFTLESLERMSELLQFRSASDEIDGRHLVPGHNLEPPMFESIDSLISQSLLRYAESKGEPRFATLETIREFALEQLEERNEVTLVRRAHAEYFLELSERGEKDLTGPDQIAWLDRLEQEHDNFREALSWLLQNDAAQSVRFAGSLWRFWWTHGHLVEGRRWLEQSLATGAGDVAQRAKALCAAGGLALEQGDYETATTQLEAALVDFRALGDKAGEALALTDLGLLARDKGELNRARDLHQQALENHRATGNKRGVAIALSNIAVVATIQADYDLADAQLTEAAETFRAIHDPFSLGAALSMLASVAERRGNYDRANRIAEEAMPMLREQEDPSAIGIALVTFGDSYRAQGERESASQHYQEALELFRGASHHRGEAGALIGLGALHLDEGKIEQALTFLAESLQLLGPTGDQELLLTALDEVARAAADSGEIELSAQFYDAAAKLREAIGTERSFAAKAVHETVIELGRKSLGAVAFASAESTGRTLSTDDAIARALEFALQPIRQPDPNLPARTPSRPVATDINLTTRELEVLQLLAAGRSNKEIAFELDISLLTVKTHVARILSKLELTTRAAAAAFALRNGLN